MSAILFISKADDPKAWSAALKKRLAGAEIRIWPEVGDVAAIDAAVVWRYPKGDLKRYPNLKLICSLGAGVDHIMADDERPAGVPIVRIVDPDLTQGMCEYILLS
ncbi:MAG TPA: glyoxylate/hydroxypyruvate reductase A, partial [Alphaproteobacteria bacterium]|nr:glyoxylate/hydroxypyruvate reductase A [Alphaproteobacteria bacterium]